jgi:hypothetical protein
MKVTDLQYKECILCITEEEALAIEKLMHEAGLKWCNNRTYIQDTESTNYVGHHVYFPSKGTHGSLSCAKDEKSIIHNASLFLNIQPNYEIY